MKTVDLFITFTTCLSVLCYNAYGLPPTGLNDNELDDYLRQCTHFDGKVVAPVREAFRTASDYTRRYISNQEMPPSIGVLAPGPPNDLGWSYNLNLASQAMQNCLSVPWIMVDSVPEEESPLVMEGLIEEGISIVFATSIEFVPYVGEVAVHHPNVLFVIPIPFPPYTEMVNVLSFSIALYEPAYLNGYMTGAMAAKLEFEAVGLIGAIHDSFVSIQSVNAYFFGYQDGYSQSSNSSSLPVFLQIWADNHSERDPSIYSMRSLAAAGAQIVGQTTDRYESQSWARDNGLLGTGSIGDMGAFLGRRILSTMWTSWSIPFIQAYANFASTNGTGWANRLGFSNVYIGSLGLGTRSIDVPDDVNDQLDSLVAQMQSDPFASWLMVWCGQRVQQILPEGQVLNNGCMTLEQSFMLDKLHPDIDSLGIIEIPVDTVTKSEGTIGGQIALSSLGIIVSVVVIIYVFVFKESAIIKLSGHIFTICAVIGLIVAYTGLILYSPDPDVTLCRASGALYALGYYIAFGFLCAKTYGFLLIRHDSELAKRKQRGIRHVIWIFALVFAIGALLVILWLSIDSEGADYLEWQEDGPSEIDGNLYYRRSVCAVSTAGEIIGWLMIAYGFGLATVSLFASYFLSSRMDRKVSTTSAVSSVWKAETTRTSIVCMSILMCGVAAIASLILLEGHDNQTALEWVLYLCGWFSISSIIVWYYLPKVYILTLRRDKDVTKSLNHFTTAHTQSDSIGRSGSGETTSREEA